MINMVWFWIISRYWKIKKKQKNRKRILKWMTMKNGLLTTKRNRKTKKVEKEMEEMMQ